MLVICRYLVRKRSWLSMSLTTRLLDTLSLMGPVLEFLELKKLLSHS